MELDFFNIFKRAEFNTLMLSLAIAAWILHFFVFRDILILGGAIMSTAYCIIRFIVFSYQNLFAMYENKKSKDQNAKEKKEKEANLKAIREMEISRMFIGLAEEKKKRLASILLKGERDEYNYNMLHFNKYSQDINTLSTAQATTNIFRGAYDEGVHTIELKYFTDTIAVVIDPCLYDMIKKYIDDNGLILKPDC